MSRVIHASSTVFLFLALVACGSVSDRQDGSDASANPTRNIVAKIVPSIGGAEALSFSESASTAGCRGIAKAVALGAGQSGSAGAAAELNDSGDGCIMRLGLKVGEFYSIRFMDDKGCLVATLAAPSGSIIKVPDGSGDIDLGNISVSPGKAYFPLYVYCGIPEHEASADCNEESCLYDPCSIYYSCDDAGLDGQVDSALCQPAGEAADVINCNLQF